MDGEPTEFEYYPQNYECSESESKWSTVLTPNSAAEAAGSAYVSALERELVPNLLINCCKGFKTGNEQQDQILMENGTEYSNGEIKQVSLTIFPHYKLDLEVILAFLHYSFTIGKLCSITFSWLS